MKKTLQNLHIYTDTDYREELFYACAYTSSSQLLKCHSITCLQRITLLKTEALCVVSVPRTVLRQTRTFDKKKSWASKSVNV